MDQSVMGSTVHLYIGECPSSGTETLFYGKMKHLIPRFQDFVRTFFDFSLIKYRRSTNRENKIGAN